MGERPDQIGKVVGYKKNNYSGLWLSWESVPIKIGKVVGSKNYKNKYIGAVAQLGERFVRNEQVVGSIPISSTK